MTRLGQALKAIQEHNCEKVNTLGGAVKGMELLEIIGQEADNAGPAKAGFKRMVLVIKASDMADEDKELMEAYLWILNAVVAAYQIMFNFDGGVLRSLLATINEHMVKQSMPAEES